MSNKNYLRIVPLILLIGISHTAMAFLPDDAPVPKGNLAPTHQASPKSDKAKHHSKTHLQPKRDWCTSKGGRRDEHNKCTRNLSPEECVEIDGKFDAQGVCFGSPMSCEEVGGSYNENGECIL